jgi:hypothetical protein
MREAEGSRDSPSGGEAEARYRIDERLSRSALDGVVDDAGWWYRNFLDAGVFTLGLSCGGVRVPGSRAGIAVRSGRGPVGKAGVAAGGDLRARWWGLD